MVKRINLILGLLLFSSIASAGGESVQATITSVGVGEYYSGQCGFDCMVLSVNPAPTGSTPCNYSGGWHFAIDLSAPEASSVISTVLASKAAGTKIGIKGNNICTNNGGIEKISYVFTQ